MRLTLRYWSYNAGRILINSVPLLRDLFHEKEKKRASGETDMLLLLEVEKTSIK